MIALIVYLWEQELTPTHIVGEVYAEVSQVMAPQSGIVTWVPQSLFEPVVEGDLIARIEPIPPAVVESSLQVLQAEMELTRLGGFGVLQDQERILLNQKELYHDWLAARARVGVLVINLRQSQLELERAEELLVSRSIAISEVDNLTAMRDALAEEKRGAEELAEALGRSVAEFSHDIEHRVRDDTLASALRFQEARLRQLETELQAIDVYAPLSGVITTLHVQKGAFSSAGQLIAVIRSTQSQHIIGYVRQPAGTIPQVGDAIEVVTRGSQRKSGMASVLRVGPQFEPLGPAFQSSFAQTAEERALPLLVSMPSQMAIRPGEVVDLRMVNSRR